MARPWQGLKALWPCCGEKDRFTINLMMRRRSSHSSSASKKTLPAMRSKSCCPTRDMRRPPPSHFSATFISSSCIRTDRMMPALARRKCSVFVPLLSFDPYHFRSWPTPTPGRRYLPRDGRGPDVVPVLAVGRELLRNGGLHQVRPDGELELVGVLEVLGVGGDERLGGDVPHADSASFFGHGCCRLLWRCFDA